MTRICGSDRSRATQNYGRFSSGPVDHKSNLWRSMSAVSLVHQGRNNDKELFLEETTYPGLRLGFPDLDIGTRDSLFITVRNIQDGRVPTNLPHSSREEPLEMVPIPPEPSGLELQCWTHVWRGSIWDFVHLHVCVVAREVSRA